MLQFLIQEWQDILTWKAELLLFVILQETGEG